ncbi:MAG: hypothetical protein WCG25_08395 [bacterium]
MIIAANILPALSLVLIFLVHTKNVFRLAFILPVPLLYQLAISLSSIVDFVFELGRSITSSSTCASA